MYFLYSLALTIVFIILSPYFAYQAIRNGKYHDNFSQRLGRIPSLNSNAGQKVIWVHAVSVGELLTAIPLINALASTFPECCIAVSSTTATGQRLAHERLEGNPRVAGIFYFPFDWAFSIRRALSIIQPEFVLILETEIWPNFLRECKRRRVPVALVNGRISERSLRRYKVAGTFIARVLQDFSLIVMQGEADAERIKNLGATRSRIKICGNLKHDAAIVSPVSGTSAMPAGAADATVPTGNAVGSEVPSTAGAIHKTVSKSSELDTAFSLSSLRHLIVAGSTAPGEEEMVLQSLRDIRTQPGLEDVRLLLAPRHPERFDEVAALIVKQEFTLARRSGIGAMAGVSASTKRDSIMPERGQETPDVFLLDTIGELARAYRFAAVVFVGGSLVPRGGHNVIEPAVEGKPIIVGPFTHNFQQIITDFVKESALIQVQEASSEQMQSALTRELSSLLQDRERAENMGSRAAALAARSRGAVLCTIQAITELLKGISR